ncbi:MAG: DUF552 domain-containing protein [Propionibacteriales bacterium]|nr:DUF552 domain-containing protein [Propionibacteriales bacterium]
MGTAMRKMGVYLGLVEDTDRFDDEYADFDDRRGELDPRPVHAVPDDSGAVTELSDRRRPTTTIAELSRIVTLHPRTYNEARTIGENFRDGIPVIMNLSEMDDSDAKRLVDFAAGLIFGVRGSIERVTKKVFLLSPPNVTVAAEDKQRIAEGGFFNQS